MLIIPFKCSDSDETEPWAQLQLLFVVEAVTLNMVIITPYELECIILWLLEAALSVFIASINISHGAIA